MRAREELIVRPWLTVGLLVSTSFTTVDSTWYGGPAGRVVAVVGGNVEAGGAMDVEVVDGVTDGGGALTRDDDAPLHAAAPNMTKTPATAALRTSLKV